MMFSDNHLVVYEKDNVRHKICRILFGSDGSYSVTSPYHPENKAVLLKQTIVYKGFSEENYTSYADAIDSGDLDDDKKPRLKLSYHASGFVQFSGEGIMSGLDEDGNPKGIGVHSWPLTEPAEGPAFIISLLGLEKYKRADGKIRGQLCVFNHEELPPDDECNGFVLEGFYFPASMRRFINREKDGTPFIPIWHPTNTVLKLKVLLPSKKCDLQGFIGLTLYQDQMHFPEDVTVAYVLSSSTGNLRISERGEREADGLLCIYPRMFNSPTHRSLNLRPRIKPV